MKIVKFDRIRTSSMISCIFWFTLNERKKNGKLTELLGLELVSLLIRNGRFRLSGYVEGRDDVQQWR